MIQRCFQNHDIVAAILIDLPRPGLPERVRAEAAIVFDGGGSEGPMYNPPRAFAGERAQFPSSSPSREMKSGMSGDSSRRRRSQPR